MEKSPGAMPGKKKNISREDSDSPRDRKNQRKFRNKRSHRWGWCGDGEPRVFYWLYL